MAKHVLRLTAVWIIFYLDLIVIFYFTIFQFGLNVRRKAEINHRLKAIRGSDWLQWEQIRVITYNLPLIGYNLPHQGRRRHQIQGRNPYNSTELYDEGGLIHWRRHGVVWRLYKKFFITQTRVENISWKHHLLKQFSISKL